MKIGIPQALGYHYFSSLWKAFLCNLGCTVIESGRSDRNILERGNAVTPGEACLPLKCFMGHALHLAGRVDSLFVPRMVCMQKKPFIAMGCPKYIGLPDMVKALIPSVRMISPFIDLRKRTEMEAFADCTQQLGFKRKAGMEAYRSAKESCKPSLRAEPGVNEVQRVNIGILGHSYLVHDSFLSFDILKKLSSLGANVIDCSSYGNSVASLGTHKRVSWYFEDDILCSAVKLLTDSKIDGIIYLLSFGCGAGSITSEIIDLELKSRDSVPLMRVVIDEHTGEAGVMTRLESYTDMLKMRKGF